MPLPVISNVFRVTLNWSLVDGVTPRNVIHFRCAGGDENDVGAAFDAGVANMASPSHLFHACADDMVCTNLEIIKLDGNSATVPYVLATNLTGGSGTGETVPSACVVVSLHTAQRGPAHRGRVYGGPLPEGAMANGIVNTTSLGLMATAWADFISGANAATPSADLVVASYKHSTAATVTAHRIDRIIGSQRRRTDQLR